MRVHWIILGAVAVGAVAAGTYAVPVAGHHAFGAEFDRDAPVRLEGDVYRVEWVNPHSWIHIEVENAAGEKEVWGFEGGTPHLLMRHGLSRDCLAPGTRVTIDGYMARDPSLRTANGRDVTLPDGNKYFLGWFGAGAPYEGVRIDRDVPAC